ncbi:restriction endonuclease [Nocardia yamanashiensis]|uniref:restriction endonuclease n=1 Tax=Nocardia yamanashiensis TaxID=209247 RepID=UPI001E5CA27A|nr:restriction endonuclease [Nocardia yamanashiensis]UGT44536.1 restriction endonuclease [Nocardia yamanashiensis]
MTYGSYGPYSQPDRPTARQLERERAQAAADARDRQAAAKTEDVGRRTSELESLLRSSLARNPAIDLVGRRRSADVPPFNLGTLERPYPVPERFTPAEPRPLRRLLGGSKRYEEELLLEEQRYAFALAEYQRRELARQQHVAQARQEHLRRAEEAERTANKENQRLDGLIRGLAEADRYAVSEYIEMVLEESPYYDVPVAHHAGYVPESSLLAIECFLPSVEVVPAFKSFRHIKTRKAIEPVARPLKEIRDIYQRLIAQIALRSVHEAFAASSPELISTVAFMGRVRGVDPVTGQQIAPYLISMRATREQFTPLVLDEPKFNPVDCVRKHFYANVSPHPDELMAVDPVMTFDMADPRIVDPVDILSEIDKRPNLLDYTPTEFEEFVHNLFAKIGFETKLFGPSAGGGVDCVAYDTRPMVGGKYIVQAKLFTKTVRPTHVRDLWGTVNHEGATKGIMITTSGYGPDSYNFANGKRLDLIDGSGLLALCRQHGIPARIVHRPRRG